MLALVAPVSADEASAQATTNSLISSLVAADLDITFRTTPETVAVESHAISLAVPLSLAFCRARESLARR